MHTILFIDVMFKSEIISFMRCSTACAKHVKLGSLEACSLKEKFENICFEMACGSYIFDCNC